MSVKIYHLSSVPIAFAKASEAQWQECMTSIQNTQVQIQAETCDTF